MKPLSIIISHITAALILLVIMGLVYITIQHTHRNEANDPQLQIARDFANKLAAGQANEIFETFTIDIGKSLDVFVVAYNKKGQPVASTGTLEGKIPQLPKGVLDYAATYGENIITWQPREGQRYAMVVENVGREKIENVAVGRSLKEVEARESYQVNVLLIAFSICFALLILNAIIQLNIYRNSITN